MLAVGILLAIWGPYLAGNLAGFIRYRNIRSKLRALTGKDRKRMALEAQHLLTEPSREPMLAGWGLVAIILAMQFVVPGTPFGKGLGIVLTLGVGAKRLVQDYRLLRSRAHQRALRERLMQLTESGKAWEVEGLLEGAWNSKDLELQYWSVKWLVKWKSPWAIGFLRKIKDSALDFDIRNLSESGVQGGEKLMLSQGMPPIDRLREMVSQSKFWLRLALSYQGKHPGFLGEGEAMGFEGEAGPPEVVEAFLLQGALATQHPHNYCLDGFSRGSRYALQGWEYVLGNSSQDYRNMQPGVFEAIGVIGPMPETPGPESILRIQMWDPEMQKALPREIDVLEVRAGAELNYDWAINAVVESLRNRFPDRELKFELWLDEAVSLSDNTRVLLQRVSKGAP